MNRWGLINFAEQHETGMATGRDVSWTQSIFFQLLEPRGRLPDRVPALLLAMLPHAACFQVMSSAPRLDGRKPDQLRTIAFEAGVAPYATGSVLISFGATRVICAATIEAGVPTWMKQQRVPGGWLTAEYSMLPYSTLERKSRDISRGKLDGRTVEIQRLIGRSLRAVIDLQKLGQNTLWLDCDVLQADGGTRTASITGAYLAARLAVQKLLDAKN